MVADFRLPNGRYIWVMHHHIPSMSNEALQRIRKQARVELIRLYAGKLGEILPKTRVTATINCGDGSIAEVELAADFLKGSQRRRA